MTEKHNLSMDPNLNLGETETGVRSENWKDSE